MIRINLAPPSVKKGAGLSIPSFNLGMLFGAIALVLVVVLGGWWWSLSAEIKRLNTEIAENKKQADRLKVVIAEGQRYRRDTASRAGTRSSQAMPTSWPCLAASAFSKGMLSRWAMAWV